MHAPHFEKDRRLLCVVRQLPRSEIYGYHLRVQSIANIDQHGRQELVAASFLHYLAFTQRSSVVCRVGVGTRVVYRFQLNRHAFADLIQQIDSNIPLAAENVGAG